MNYRQIIAMVAEAHNVTPAELVGERRTLRLVIPRQKAMWLCRKHIRGASLHQIGLWFNRDHGTVLYAMQSIPHWPKKDLDDLAELEARLGVLEGVPADWGKAIGRKVLVKDGFNTREVKVLKLSTSGEYVQFNMGKKDGIKWFPVGNYRILDEVRD